MTTATEVSVTMQYRLLSKQEVARFLGYTVRTLDRLIAGGKIPYLSLPTGRGGGRKIKFDSRALDAWVAENAKALPAGEGR